ncbi:MAG: hypothetical protein J6Z43_07970 [Clostridiales bacterium]|nr:hypothetical protein [Clostridiales bacterium]
MEDLIRKLNNVNGTFQDFVIGVVLYAREDPSHIGLISDYIDNNPEASTSDILMFISQQPDFFDNLKEERSKKAG